MVLNCADQKVTVPIIRSVSVDMVDHLSALKFAANGLFSYVHMLFFTDSMVDAKLHVSMLVYASIPSASEGSRLAY